MRSILSGVFAALIVSLIAGIYTAVTTKAVTDLPSFLAYAKSHQAFAHLIYTFIVGFSVYCFSYIQYRLKRIRACHMIMRQTLARLQGGDPTVRITLLKCWHIYNFRLFFRVYARRGSHANHSRRLLIRQKHGFFPGLVGRALEEDGVFVVHGLEKIPERSRLLNAGSIDAFDSDERARIRSYMESLRVNSFKTLASLSMHPHRAYASLIKREEQSPWGVVVVEENGYSEQFSNDERDELDNLCRSISAVFS